MSNAIEQRVVEMRFDNSHFEKNVSTTMSTLEKLKQKLHLKGASKGLEGIDTAAKNVNMSGLSGAVDSVTARFSALQVMGVTALANITNSAVNAGKRIVKSLTIDPIKTGFEEYETKMGSIQTILANTEHQGTTLNDVTRVLEELNLYADKTIYNFQQMTKNIGTFTAAGVDLETSARSIQGIANLAAVSGSTSQQASTAMYQLSQALASGTVKLMDWNSVVNAGMGGKVFQNALTRTAAVMAGAAEDVEGWRKENIEAHGSFRDSLTEGAWLTTDVLTATLEQFTMAAEEGSDAWNEYKKSLTESGYTEKQAEEILKMARTANDAATKVKTFTQLMDTLREAAQSGWAQTWELIVGDFEEAKAFFTELSDIFGGIIGKSAERRNTFFGDAMSSNFDKLIGKINDAGIETEKFEESIREVVGSDHLDGLIADYGSLEKAIKEGAISSDQLKNALDNITGTSADTKIASFVEGLKEIERVLQRGHVGEDVKKLQTALDELGYDLGPPGIDGIIGPITEKAIKAFQEAEGLVADGIAGPETLAALEKAGTKVEEISKNVDDLKMSAGELIDEITKESGRELLLESLMNVIKAIQRPLSAVGEALRNTFSITPDQLYGGLEKLKNLTDSFVMKGPLDAGNWVDLISNVNDLGISTADFVNKLKETMKSHGIDFDELIDEYDTLGEAFKKGAISLDIIRETLLSFDGISDALLIGGETADKVRRTFEGLFAIFDIVGTLAGGGLKIAFEVLTKILSKFDLDILDVTASVGDAIVGFRNWIDSIINIGAVVDAIFPYVEGFVKAISDGINAFKGTEEFAKLANALSTAADSFANWIETLKTSENLGEDIVAGLVNGLVSGAGLVWDAAVALAVSILDSICSFLGIHSPATTMIEVGENTVAGLTIGLQNGISSIGTTVQGIGAKILEWFKTAFAKIREWITGIDFGAWFAVGVGAGMIFVIKTIGSALDTLAAPLEGLGEMFEDVGIGAKAFLKGLGSNLKASAWEKRGKALLSFAGAIAILAASVYVLSTIDSGKLWGAVGAIAVLAAIIAALAGVLKLINASGGLGLKDFMSAINFGGLTLMLIGLSISLLAISAVVKKIGELDPEQAKQGFLGLAGLVAAIGVVLAAYGLLVKGKSAQNISKFGGMLIKMSVALLLMVGVAKLAGSLDDSDMKHGAIVVGAFAVFVGILSAISMIPSKNITKLGGMMMKISVALLLMIAVVKLAGKLTPEEFSGTSDFLVMFLGFVTGLQLIGMIPGSNINKLGSTLLGISTAMVMLIAVAKLITKMQWGDMGKAAVGILGLTGIIGLLVGIVKTAGKDSPKIAATLLAMSVAIGILAGIAVMLSLVKLAGLAKGIAAVGLLAVIMRLMITATRGANDCKGNLIVITVAIGLLAAAVAALSLIDPGKLWSATIAISLMMGMFALVVKASSNITASMGTLIVLTGAIAILAGIIFLLSTLPVESTLSTAGALSGLLLALAGALKILSTVTHVSAGALISMGIMLVIVGLLGGLLYLLKDLPVESTLSTAAALSTLLLSMSISLAVLTLVGAAAPAAFAGMGALATLIVGLGVIIAAIGALADKFPQLETFLDTGIPILEKIGNALGSFFGNIIGGFLDGVTDGLPGMATNLSNFMTNLQPFIDGMNGLDDSFGTKIENLVQAISTLAQAELLGTLTSWLPGSDDTLTQFATQLESFGSSMSKFASDTAGINPESIGAVVDAATKLTSITPPGDGLFGTDGIDDYGKNVKTFGECMKAYCESVADIDTAAVITSVDAAKTLTSITLPDDGTFGTDGIDDFGKNVKSFGKSLVAYSDKVTEIDPGAINNSSIAVNKIVGMISSLAGLDTSGIASFKTAIKDLSTVNVEGIVKAFANASSSLQSAGSNMIQSISTGIQSKSAVLITSVTTVITSVKNFLIANASEFNSAGSALATELAKGMSVGKPAVLMAGTTLVTTAATAARSGYANMVSAGYWLSAGLAQGMLSGMFMASAAGAAIAYAAYEAAKRALGVASPSKVMYEVGKWTGVGFINALNDYSDKAAVAGSDMANSAVDGLSNSISKISDIINSDIDTQPTIRPVLDLSDVESGAGRIGGLLGSTPVGVNANLGAISTMMGRRGQNGANDDVVYELRSLRNKLDNLGNTTYQVNGVTYDDGSNMSRAVSDMIRYAKIERRV